ncbi:unnamed protein product [Linum trigynum]|uniref:Bifunctional inhibitor/plant lipid transfer protein/seed storage helical domain-containing protein n=1 Tax=Linum trigynum TaxID=586398 RepID=A0AAV2FXE2_9ROSI
MKNTTMITFSRVLLLVVAVVICLQASTSHAVRPASANDPACNSYQQALSGSCMDYFTGKTGGDKVPPQCCQVLTAYVSKLGTKGERQQACTCSHNLLTASGVKQDRLYKVPTDCKIPVQADCSK